MGDRQIKIIKNFNNIHMQKTKNKTTADKGSKKVKKIQYFAVDRFVDDVITAMDLGEVTAPVLVGLKQAISQKLGDRILFTVLNSFKDRELDILENLIQDHPELDELDALWLAAHEVEGLNEKLIREINSLYAELTYDAEKIGQALNHKK